MQAPAVSHFKQPKHFKQAGVALITTLLITGIVAIVALRTVELTSNRHSRQSIQIPS